VASREPQRRGVARRAPLTPITVEFLLDGYVAAHAEVVDISATGLGMLSADGFGSEQGYEIRLACERDLLPRVEVPMARVVWCQAVDASGRRRGGVRFDRRRRDTRAALERLMHATCPASASTTDPA
jgi:PilZ domain